MPQTIKWLGWEEPIRFPNDHPSPKITDGLTMLFHCDNGFLHSELRASNNIQVECRSGRFLKIGSNKTYDYHDLMCRSETHKNVIVLENKRFFRFSKLLKCESEHLKAYNVSVQKPGSSSPELVYIVCVDTITMQTKFAFQPKNEIPAAKLSVKPPESRSFKELYYWGFEYFGKTSKERLELLEAYSKCSQKRCFDSKVYYFQRGHLVPSGDFTRSAERNATYEYINAAPRWEILDKNHWGFTERAIRQIRIKSPGKYEVYTGTYGILKLPNCESKNGVYLAENLLPVPLLHWKVLFGGNKDKIIVGVNDPTIKNSSYAQKEHIICTGYIKFHDMDANNGKGLTYECRVDDRMFWKNLGKTEGIVQPNAHYKARNIINHHFLSF